VTELPDIDETGDERTMLLEFLDYFRAVFARKIDGLDEHTARTTLPPSPMHLLGMTRHLADVERWWFRVFFAGIDIPMLFESDTDPDLDWHAGPDDTIAHARALWRDEVAAARAIVAPVTDLDTLGAVRTHRRGDVSLRWILVHMIEEYARHCGHADLIREAIDGVTGD
jgi:uncharacterized damage-inducible protein DinB